MALIKAQYGGTCLTCEEPYQAGDEVQWSPGVGCWHHDCLAPRNLRAYVVERNKHGLAQKFGS